MSIRNYHEKVAQKILEEVPGYAQFQAGKSLPEVDLEVSGTLQTLGIRGEITVSYDGQEYTFTNDPHPGEFRFEWREVMYREMVLEVAAGYGKASPATFSEARIMRIVRDYRRFDSRTFEHLHDWANIMDEFYLQPGGNGVSLLR